MSTFYFYYNKKAKYIEVSAEIADNSNSYIRL